MCAWAWTSTAAASPAVQGTRNVALSDATRASATGTNAAITNPAGMSYSQVFAVEPIYQLSLPARRHGMGAVVMDSLNSPRVAVGLGYLFMHGTPTISFIDGEGIPRSLDLSHFGHEGFLSLSVSVVKQWLSVGLKPKYLYTSLRYRDPNGVARNARGKQSAFGLDAAVAGSLAGWANVAVVGYNLVGNARPAYSDNRELTLTGYDITADSIDHESLSPLSDYPLSVGWGVAVFPLRKMDFSLNFDSTYDFTSYRDQEKFTRKTLAGGMEFVLGPVPLRAGANWDTRGRGREDDRTYVSAGLGYLKSPDVGGVGIDLGFSFSQQVSGRNLETVLSANLGIRIHPDL